MSAEAASAGLADAAAADGWKLTLPCTPEEARAIAEDPAPLGDIDPPPVLMTSEPDPARPDAWQLDAYLDAPPDAAVVALVRALVPSAAAIAPLIARLPPADWVSLSQAGLAPIVAGRFHVVTPVYSGAPAGKVPPGGFVFTIPAGRAFGTGHHETTSGCLTMLDRLARQGRRCRDIADIGTGTGLLAFAARALWPEARLVASDIDPVAIAVAAENAAANRVPLGRASGAIELIAAPGLSHARLKARAPYDLLIANILAGPLIALAPAFARALAPGGSLLLAGLLEDQAAEVAAAYRARGVRLADRVTIGVWPTLRLVKRGSAAPIRGARGRA